MRLVIKTGLIPLMAVILISFLPGLVLAQTASHPKNSKEGTSQAEEGGKSVHFYTSNPVVAEVDGQLITLDELKNAQTHEMMERLHGILDDALKEKVLSQLAASHPELAPARDKEVSDRDIEMFYRNEPGIRDLGPLDQLRSQIRNFLEKRYRQDAWKTNAKKFQEAEEKGWVVNYLQPPNDFRLKAKIETAMLWFNNGDNPKRSVFVMEYSDFLCPFCRKVQDTLQELRQKYADTVQFGYRHFPIHQEARDLSEAVECARDQGRFWQFQRLIFVDARRLQQNKVELMLNARRAGVQDLVSFEDCLDSGKYEKRVQKDFEAGALLGIQGTPTFIIGKYDHATATVDGEMFSGAVPPSKFITLIEKYLNPPQN